MSPVFYAEMTWEEARALGKRSPVAILPIGAIEAHGPHLPLSTDSIISESMAENAAHRLEAEGKAVVLLPTLSYTAAPFAAEFPGTLSVRPETVTEMIYDLGIALRSAGVTRLALANAHLDPTHLASLHAACKRLRKEGLEVAFPDLTEKPWALRLSDEFRSGACHAGRFESSVVLSVQPNLVKTDVLLRLPPNPASLSVAIREGKRTFREADGPRAYFGAPADATAAEGTETVEALGAILYDAIAARADETRAPS